MQEILNLFNAEVFVDAKELYCPQPIMLLHQALNNSKSGTKILLATKDPAARKDVQKMTQFLNHKLLNEKSLDGILYFLIEKI